LAFPVSAGVVVREFDLTTIVPGVDTSVGAFAGVFRWGPIGERVLVDSEATLANRFGLPTNFNGEGWFACASFLSYSNALMVSRAADTTTAGGANSALNALANTSSVSNVVAQVVKNEDHYNTKDGAFAAGVLYVAKYPGALGNSLRVSVCDAANQFTSSINLAALATGGTLTVNVGSNTATLLILGSSITAVNTAALSFQATVVNTDLLEIGNSSIGRQYLKVTNVAYTPATDSQGNTITGNATVTIHFETDYRLSTNFSVATAVSRYWEYWDLVDTAPGQSTWQAANGNTSANDELHVIVVDNLGKFTGVPGTVLEKWAGMSRATDAKRENNETNYYKTVINQGSQYMWWAADRSNAVSNTGNNLTSATTTSILDLSFGSGQDGADEANVTVGILTTAWDLFQSSEDVDVGLLITGKSRGGTHGGQMGNYLIDNIAEIRMDCVAFISPDKNDVVNNVGSEETDVIAFRNSLRSSSYGFLDSGYKYMYDRYNDVWRWIPLCGDMAGLAARTEATNDAWWSPGGFNRGNVKNLSKLAYNPGKKAQRDLLYKSNVNPVVTFVGNGTVLFGDKTLLAKPSAFDRINVRRLFIVLEKAIKEAAKYSLFEFNDAFTRAQFKNMITPYLRDVKGRRGLTDFLVVCDESNNPGSVIDRNEFVADIYLKPARSINYITLNFVAVGTDVAFNTVVGKFG
jgi:hypothetical protein